MSYTTGKILAIINASISSKLLKVKKHPSIVNNLLHKNLSSSSKLTANVSFNLSDIGEGIREVVVKEWYIKEGDKVAQFDNICEVQSDKASVTITSRYDGHISKLHYKIDDIALVGKPLIDVETDDAQVLEDNKSQEISDTGAKDEPPQSIEIKAETKSDVIAESTEQNLALCIPSVRRLAKEYNVNLSEVKGTGKHSRILKEDVLKYLNNNEEVKNVKPVQSETLENKIEAIRGFQKAMLKTMTAALKIPHFVYSDEIKITKLSELRKSLKTQPQLAEVKLSFLPFFVKAASNALQRYPIINASIDEKCENIIYKNNHNIGIAMNTKVGLAVPVIKNVGNLTIIQIANELNRLIKSGRNGSFAPSDLAGGTFTISNIGVIGGTYTKPVILAPQVSIIALGATQLLPRFDVAKNVIAEEVINISAAADHRVIDGATMANFIQTLKKQLENPNLLFLNL